MTFSPDLAVSLWGPQSASVLRLLTFWNADIIYKSFKNFCLEEFQRKVVAVQSQAAPFSWEHSVLAAGSNWILSMAEAVQQGLLHHLGHQSRCGFSSFLLKWPSSYDLLPHFCVVEYAVCGGKFCQKERNGEKNLTDLTAELYVQVVSYLSVTVLMHLISLWTYFQCVIGWLSCRLVHSVSLSFYISCTQFIIFKALWWAWSIRCPFSCAQGQSTPSVASYAAWPAASIIYNSRTCEEFSLNGSTET